MNTLKGKWSVVTAMMVLLAACASAPQRPAWLAGDTSQYNNASMLLGRGEAMSLEQAKDRARSDLAKIFKVAVNESSEDTRVFKRSSEAGATASSGQEEITRSTFTRTDQMLQGVRIAETWRDSKSGTFYALAVLPRSQAAAGLRQEISQLDDATQRYLGQARDAKDLLDKIAAAQEALKIQEDRAGYQQTLKIVDRSGQGVPSTWSTARLRADVAELRGRLRIAVKPSSDAPPQLATSVAGALATAGYKTVSVENADYVLFTTVKLAEPVAREGWYWVTGRLDVQLHDVKGQRVRGSKHWPIKASAQDPAMAQQRAWNQVDGWLNKELGQALLSFTEGDDHSP